MGGPDGNQASGGRGSVPRQCRSIAQRLLGHHKSPAGKKLTSAGGMFRQGVGSFFRLSDLSSVFLAAWGESFRESEPLRILAPPVRQTGRAGPQGNPTPHPQLRKKTALFCIDTVLQFRSAFPPRRDTL